MYRSMLHYTLLYTLHNNRRSMNGRNCHYILRSKSNYIPSELPQQHLQ